MKTKHNVKSLLIEISGMCNAKCPYCAQWRIRQENHFGGIMSPILFEQIIDHLFKIGVVDKNHSVALLSWGEPFLNPKINDILRILKNKKLKACISSNFIIRPNIDKELLSTISVLVFSLSGFSQESYGRIHGASLDKVLNNFESLYTDLREYSPGTKIELAWHRYSFNENEFWDAYKYFNRPAIHVAPVIAYFNDPIEMMEFLKGKLSDSRLKMAEKDIFLDRIRKSINYHKKKSKNYHCPGLDTIVIDESGQLLTCCGFTRYDSDHIFGNVLKMSAEEILSIKDPICNECISSGLARFVYNPIKSLPSGGGLYDVITYGIKNKFYYVPLQCKYILVRTLRQFPHGEKIINAIKNLR